MSFKIPVPGIPVVVPQQRKTTKPGHKNLVGLLWSSYPEVGVELIQNQTHGASQVTHIRGFLVQCILENLKVVHPLHCKTVVNDVGLQQVQMSEQRTSGDTQQNSASTHLVHGNDEGQFGLVEDAEGEQDHMRPQPHQHVNTTLRSCGTCRRRACWT